MSRIKNLIKKSTNYTAWLPWIGLALGLALLGTVSSGQPERFWLAQLVFYLPAAWRLLSVRARRGERAALLAAMALFSFLPRLTACSGYFCTAEEMGWWRSTKSILLGGPAVQNNPLGAIQGTFPGLPLLTAILQQTGGLSVFYTGLALAGILHIISLLGVYLLGERMFLSSRAGAAAALLYMAMMGSAAYSSQFSGQTLAGTLVIAALLAAQFTAEGAGEPDRGGWRMAALLLTAAVVVIHPGSALALVAVLLFMAVTARFMRYGSSPGAARRLLRLALIALICTAAWVTTMGADSLRTLDNSMIQAYRQNIQMLPHLSLTAVLALLALLVLAVYALWVITRMRLPVLSASFGILASGILFILTYPLLPFNTGNGTLTFSGDIPWMVTGLGGSLLAGLALAWISAPRLHKRNKAGSMLVSTLVVLVPLSLLLGIPSSFEPDFTASASQQDAANLTGTLFNAARWMALEHGPGNRVASDIRSIQILGSYGLQDPAFADLSRQPIVLTSRSWDLNALLSILQTRATYFVINHDQVPASQVTQDGTETGVPTSLSTESVDKFEELSLLARVYDSGDIVIYHLDDRTLQSRPDNPIAVTGTASPPDAPQSPPLYNSGGQSWPRAAAFFLILLFLPGYLTGELLFERWEKMDWLARGVLSASLSMTAAIGAGLLVELNHSPVEHAPWFLLGGSVAAALIVLRQKARKPEPARRSRQAEAFWSGANVLRRAVPTATLLVVGISFAQNALTISPPHPQAATEFAMRASAPLTVQITNREASRTDYYIITSGEDLKTLRTETIPLEPGETRLVNLQPLFDHFPKDGILYIDLYKDGQLAPFRSLHLPFEQASKLAGLQLTKK